MHRIEQLEQELREMKLRFQAEATEPEQTTVRTERLEEITKRRRKEMRQLMPLKKRPLSTNAKKKRPSDKKNTRSK
jgi:hypothetical protein